MIQSTYTTRVLTASEGCFLTQVNCENIENAVLSEKVYLAVNDAPENWKEVTAEEANAIREEQERLRELHEKELENPVPVEDVTVEDVEPVVEDVPVEEA